MTDRQGSVRPGLLDLLHGHMANVKPMVVDDDALAQAAVALIVAPDPFSILFIKRATRAGDPWSGQMALPGGRAALSDADLKETAVRETQEEVALALDGGRYLGQLDDVAPRTPDLPPLMVRPFLFALPRRAGPRPHTEEVEEAFWLPVANLVRPGVYRAVPLTLKGTVRVFPGYQVGPNLVWGLTERIITPLFRSLRLIP
jgi:8-oxo-dGTP pyrophosphatase MutT (NUDIX family)